MIRGIECGGSGLVFNAYAEAGAESSLGSMIILAAAVAGYDGGTGKGLSSPRSDSDRRDSTRA